MKLLYRLFIFILMFMFYIAESVAVPCEGVVFMQVEADVDVVCGQSAERVFSYDVGVFDELAGSSFSRFSIKTVCGDEVVDELFARLVYIEEVNGDTVEYYFSPILEKFVFVAGQKVNLQVACSEGVSTIGYPMIDVGF